jgi:hypothetical protein
MVWFEFSFLTQLILCVPLSKLSLSLATHPNGALFAATAFIDTHFLQSTLIMLHFIRKSTAVPLRSLPFGSCAARYFSALVLPNITNEPFKHYAPGSAERSSVLTSCKRAREECPEIPLVINGQAVRTGDIAHQVQASQAPCALPSLMPMLAV